MPQNRSLDYEDLLNRAKAGEAIPSSTLSAIRAQLDTGAFEEDPYVLIHILGKAGAESSAPVIAKYAQFDSLENDSEMIRRIAVQTLAREWGLREYFDLVVEKAFKDTSPYVRSVAAANLGGYGLKFQELAPVVAGYLVDGMANRADEEWDVVLGFQTSLEDLFGVPYSERNLSPRELSEDEIRQDLIERAEVLRQQVEK